MNISQQDQYIKNYVNRKNVESKVPKIPKIMHQVWLGGKVPDKYNFYIDTLKKSNPDWEHRLWTDDDVASFGFKNHVIYNNTGNLGSKSDIFRYEILERFGGIYLDVDFYGVKSFNDLIYSDFFGAYIGCIQNGLFGTVPNGKIISELVSGLSKIESFSNDINTIMETTGPHYFRRKFGECANDEDDAVIYPVDFFYPFPASMRHIPQDSEYNKIVNSYNTDNTLCVHMWHTNWQK